MNTIRRDKVRRLAEAGKLVLAGSYHFDDMYGESRSKEALKVKVVPYQQRTYEEGYCYLDPGDFTTKSGAAWINPNGTITLIVHSNSNFDFQVIP